MRKARAAIVTLVAVTALATANSAGAQHENSATDNCQTTKQVYSEKHWREKNPKQGVQICPAKNKRGAQNTVEHFHLYQHYRAITPYRCEPGAEGTFAIPCYIISCESHFNWWAMNPSGAKYIYQLLGWGAPPPSSFKGRLGNHEIAAGLSLSNWACA